MVGYNNNSKSYRVYAPTTRRIIESRSVIFIDPSSRLLPLPLETTSQKIDLPRNGMDDHNYVPDGDVLRDLRDHTSVLEPLPAASADHIAVGGRSDNPPVAELLERISEITRRNALDGGVAAPPQKGAMPGREERMDGVSQEAVLEPQEQAISPAGASMKILLVGSQPLEQRGHTR